MCKQKLLIITYTNPYPPVAGGQVSIYGTINYLRKLYDITLVFASYSKNDSINLDVLAENWPDVKLRVFKKWIDLPSTFRQTFKLKIKRLFESIYKYKQKQHTDIKDNQVELAEWEKFPFAPLDRDYVNFISVVISETDFEIIQVEYTGLMNLVSILPSNVKKVYVQIECRYLVLRDYYYKIRDFSAYAKYVVENAQFVEMSFLKKYDYVFALSKSDESLLSQYKGFDKVFYAPFPLLSSYFAGEEVLKNYIPKKIVFLGSQAHSPNVDAVVWFIENVYQEIQNKIGLQLYVTGNWDRGYADKYSNVIFTGFLSDVNDFLINSILVVPIFLGGGGIRAKILHAMAAYVPVISTKLGCEGINGIEHNKNILVAENSIAFMSSIEKLLSSPDFARRLILNARILVEQNYSEQVVGEIRNNAYKEIISR